MAERWWWLLAAGLLACVLLVAWCVWDASPSPEARTAWHVRYPKDTLWSRGSGSTGLKQVDLIVHHARSTDGPEVVRAAWELAAVWLTPGTGRLTLEVEGGGRVPEGWARWQVEAPSRGWKVESSTSLIWRGRDDVCASQLLSEWAHRFTGEPMPLYRTSVTREAEVREAYRDDQTFTLETPTSVVHAIVLKYLVPHIRAEWHTETFQRHPRAEAWRRCWDVVTQV